MLSATGEITINDLVPGTHAVGLGGVAGNCRVDGENPRPVTIAAGATALLTFNVTCETPPPTTGTLRVITLTSGPGSDADGYAFSIDTAGGQTIGVNAIDTVPNLAGGSHSVKLTGVANNCTLQGANPRTVLVPTGGTADLTFSLTCQATTGSIEVSTSTTGVEADANGYVFAIDGGSSRAIGINDRVTISPVLVGAHDVLLADVAANCALQGTNPFRVTVSGGGTATAAFAITCTASKNIAITTNPPVSALTSEVFDPVAQPVVRVTGTGGTPVAAAQIVASIASGSGKLEGQTTVMTDANGVGRFVDLGISGTGDQTIEFTTGTASVTSSPVSVSALSSKATTGSWGPLVNWDIVPLHMSLMPNGNILAWGKTDVPPDTMGVPRLWNPAAGPPTSAPMIMVDTMLFCSGYALMPDGRLLVSGGHLQDDHGIATTRFFTQDGAWSKGPNMAHGRWYPTVTVLPDGRALTMAGRDQAKVVVTTPEIWEGGQWVELPGAGSLQIPYYPRNFIDPKSGFIFNASERIDSRWFDVDGSSATGRGRWIAGPPHIYRFNRDYGSAVMYDAGKILVVGGGGNTGWPTPDPKASQPTATAEIIDLNAGSPAWQSTSSMANPRRHMNATILPDGQVLATGGTRGGGFVDINVADAVKAAELWNPKTGQWTTLAANSVMRVYHSVSMLLPDGTVLHGSSGDAMDGTTPIPSERNHEIFSPPYLFKGVRPTITSAPPMVSYGQTFEVTTPNKAQVTDVRWIRLGAVTHAFDGGQLANTLTFSAAANGVDVTAPASPNVAPPGYYQLFILNRNGVPSVGRVVKVQ